MSDNVVYKSRLTSDNPRKEKTPDDFSSGVLGSPEGIRTLVAGLRSQSPGPLDDGAKFFSLVLFIFYCYSSLSVPVPLVLRWGTWTRTKTNGTRIRWAANYPIPHHFLGKDSRSPERGKKERVYPLLAGLCRLEAIQRPLLAEQFNRLEERW